MRRLALGLLLLAPASIAAQGLPSRADEEPPVKRGGFVVSLSPIAYGSITSSDLTGGDSRGGMGFALSGGFGFTERLFILVDITRTATILEPGSSYHLWHLEPLLRLTPMPRRVGSIRIAPFADIGGGLIRASGERPALGGVEKITYSGSFVTVGAGLNVFVKQRWAITGGAHASIGAFSDFKRGNVTQSNLRVGAHTTRANLGLAWYPTIGR